ncbi:uncharacterized protein G2W53_039010 [Senna tora]|uniref:Uncharacterized protein n=1 Tax=Senna tora TaxID=362788 RepID=A0A834T0N7_9FABA|nr:uncharacterized protein G2W53_039010 [Senna tora]
MAYPSLVASKVAFDVMGLSHF